MPELPHSATRVASQAQPVVPQDRPAGASARMDAKTRIRLRIAAFAGADYAVNVLILFCYAAVGTISYQVPWQIFGLSLLANAAFLGSIASGLSRRLPDPSLTAPQVAAACGVNMVALTLAPQIGYMFVINVFVPLCYGSLYFERRAFLLAWVLLTAAVGLALWSTGFHLGMALSRPEEKLLFLINVAVVLGRFLAINAEVSRLRAGLHQRNKALAEATARLEHLATRDELTGLPNRREALRVLRAECERADRNGSRLCVAMVDADHFKHINDQHGHHTGDDVLRELSGALQAALRTADHVFRYGGEEFLVLLVDCDAADPLAPVERARAAVAAHPWDRLVRGLRVTVSIGSAQRQPHEAVEQVLRRADAALYEAKTQGRNRVQLAR
ncbi:GGDEF domain-containing protein [Schlegelella sp. S2-27]|uniref:diguanylate cyclase n=1 Tax=Caldimonas mangrovi TaxID=2944811 RepID=A0ABT0YM14_9BURK|nr:GGDEF domain-containing protein [Caldimonas mangrovi]MCM5679750.1 GGDEF domain-containing protein [Caldimonas mangrovi]